MIRLPARVRADLLFWTALYGGMWLGAIVKSFRTSDPATEESPNAVPSL